MSSLILFFFVLVLHLLQGISVNIELKLLLVVLFLLEVVALGTFFFNTLAALLLPTTLSILISSHLSGLLDCVGHHLLLFESFPDIVAVQTQVALFAVSEEEL